MFNIRNAILHFRATQLNHSTASAQLALRLGNRGSIVQALIHIVNKGQASKSGELSSLGGVKQRQIMYAKLEDALGLVRNSGGPPNIPAADYLRFSPNTKDNEGNAPCQRKRYAGGVELPDATDLITQMRNEYSNCVEEFNPGSYEQRDIWTCVRSSEETRELAEALLKIHPEFDPEAITQQPWTLEELRSNRHEQVGACEARKNEGHEELSLDLLKQILWPSNSAGEG